MAPFYSAAAKAAFRICFLAIVCCRTLPVGAQEVCFPVLTESPDQTVNCGDPVPDFAPCEAVSACCGPVELSSFESETGNLLESCTLSTAFGPGPDWAFWLPDLDPANISWRFEGDGHFEAYGDGTAHLWGIIYNVGNPSLRMEAHLWMQNESDWTTWSGLGRSYKDDLGIAGSNYVNWTYYELVEGFAWLNGLDGLAGSQLLLSHKPSNYYYGFQTGMAANNKNLNNGLSGWFDYTGIYNGQWVSGHGDVNVDQACSAGPEGCASTAHTRICRASNDCGVSSWADQTIYVSDTTAPEILLFESSVTQDCFAPTVAWPVAQDDCSEVFITFSDEIIEPGCGGSFIRHFTVADGCGNSIQLEQLVEVTGGVPVFTEFPTDGPVACDAIPPADTPLVQYTEGCNNTVLTIQSEQLPGECPNAYTLIRTYTLTDDCGNEVSATWTLFVSDEEAPVLINVPADATIQCGDPIEDAIVSAEDNCTAEPLIGLNAETVPLGCGYQFIRTWIAIDECGNQSEATQIITVLDEEAPTFTFIPPTAEAACGNSLDDLPSAQAEDACSDLEITFTDEPVLEGCAGGVLRTWTATDGCGNSASATQLILFTDDEAPLFTDFPEDITVSCSEVPPAESADVSFTDNCGEVNAEIVEETIPGACPGSGVITRTWTLTDACGNTSSRTWTVTTADTEPPVLTDIPEDTVISCGDPVSDAVVSATDNCTEEPLIGLSAVTVPLECGYLFERTWIAIDGCGNQSQQTQVITVEDNQAPEFTFIPPTAGAACGNSLDDLPSAQAEDACSDLEITFTDESVQEGCAGGVLRTWTATDGCGNSASATQLILFTDDEAPLFTDFPEDITVSCSEVPPAESAGVSFTDNCGEVNAEITEETIPGACPGSGVITRTWTLTDACGNTSSRTWTITTADTEPPVLTDIPEDTVISCGDPVSDAVVSATDNCTEEPLIGLSAVTVPLECGYLFERTWIAIDGCGNQSQQTQVITVEDNQAPEFTFVPGDAEIDCGGSSEGPPAVAEDACSSVTVSFTDAPAGEGCAGSLIRTWTATDGCGNSATAQQMLTYTDNAPPVFTAFPEDVTVSCSAVPNIASSGVAYTDFCSQVDAQVEETILPGDCPGEATILRTWIVTDACGNSSSQTWTITTTDNEPPVLFNIPADITLECNEQPEDAIVFATDNCSSEPLVSLSGQTVFLDCGYQLIRTWTAFDACGNTSVASQTITFEDTGAPYFVSVPETLHLSCGDPIPGTLAVADDDCSNVFVTFEDVISEDGCSGGIQRIFTATDDCGNSATATQTIFIQDNEPPFIVSFPQNEFYDCSSIPSVEDADVAFADNCSDVEVSFEETVVPGDCPGEYALLRIWTATDACGNSISPTWTLWITDQTPPVIDLASGIVFLECGAPVNLPEPVATDDCSGVAELFVTESEEPLACGYQLILNWTAVDQCGNISSAQQIVQFTDQTAPAFVFLPENETLGCDDPIPAAAELFAEDVCDGLIAAEIEEQVTPVGCTWSIIRTYRAADACGNEVVHQQVITIVDDTPPVIEGPAQTEMICGDTEGILVSATDACTDLASLTYVDSTLPAGGDAGCAGAILRTYTAADICGNTSTFDQLILLIDGTPPLFTSFPADGVVSCSSIPSIQSPLLEYTDNCSEVALTSEENIYPGDCPNEYLLERIYTLTDGCGNQASQAWYLTVVDNEAPVLFGVPADITLECGDPIPEALVFAQDNCSGITEVGVEGVTIDTDCGSQFVRTWFSVDACGNIAEASQTITFEDTTDPYFLEFPESAVIGCGDPIPPLEIPAAMDDCAGPVETYVAEESFDLGCGESILMRVFRAFDDCGNQTIWYQSISIEDQTGPLLSEYPQDITLPCDAPLPPVPVITASDECSGPAEVTFDEQLVSGSGCFAVYERTWCATDCAGNTTCWTQTISYSGGGQGMLLLQSQQQGIAAFRMRWPEEGRTEVRVFQHNGKLVDYPFSQQVEAGAEYPVVIRTSGWAPGVYLVRASQGGRSMIYRLIVME